MKTRTLPLAMLVVLSAMGNCQAGEFDGIFIGGKVGNNSSGISGGSLATGLKDTTTWGVDEGYNWDMDSFLLGADFFANNNHKADHVAQPESYSSSVIGLGLKLGVSMNNWLPYINLGYAKTKGGYDASSIRRFGLLGGLGLEYKFTPNWSVNTEWSTGKSATNNGSALSNNNITIGFRYYLGGLNSAHASLPAPLEVTESPKTEPAMPVLAPAAAIPVPAALPVPAAMPAPAIEPPAPQAKASTKPALTDKLVIIEGANFASSSSSLLNSADTKLNELVDTAKQYPEVKFEVSGHADNSGDREINKKLSASRALAVKAYLVKHGVAADRVNTIGYGDTKPISNNKTIEGRRINRRVEVRLVIKAE